MKTETAEFLIAKKLDEMHHAGFSSTDNTVLILKEILMKSTSSAINTQNPGELAQHTPYIKAEDVTVFLDGYQIHKGIKFEDPNKQLDVGVNVGEGTNKWQEQLVQEGRSVGVEYQGNILKGSKIGIVLKQVENLGNQVDDQPGYFAKDPAEAFKLLNEAVPQLTVLKFKLVKNAQYDSAATLSDINRKISKALYHIAMLEGAQNKAPKSNNPTDLYNAVELLVKNLKDNKGFWEAWQSSIAMTFYDEVIRVFGDNLFPSKESLSDVANDAANNFLTLLTRQLPETPGRGDELEKIVNAIRDEPCVLTGMHILGDYVDSLKSKS